MAPPRRRGGPRALAAVALAAAALSLPGRAGAEGDARARLLAQALGAGAKAVDLFLDEAEEAALGRQLGEPLGGPLQTVYRAGGAGAARYGVLATRRVRTHATTAVVVVDAAGAVEKVVVGAFHEPPEYLPVPAWFRRLTGRGPGARLVVGDDVAAVSGATLSARCFAAMARRGGLGLRVSWPPGPHP